MSELSEKLAEWVIDGKNPWPEIWTRDRKNRLAVVFEMEHAKLMCAARELLAACHGILSWAEHAHAEMEPEDTEAFDAVRAAIAKATGGKP